MHMMKKHVDVLKNWKKINQLKGYIKIKKLNKGLQINMSSKTKIDVRRIESNNVGNAKWKFLGKKNKWNDCTNEISKDIDKLKDNESMKCTIIGKKYNIVKKNENEAIQQNLKTKRKRLLRKILNNTSSQKSTTARSFVCNAKNAKVHIL
ncbi:hypothetical protein RFI_22467 [Reticulomyxa filosa]|uniref:Uncharacterized protein n=1 Tax=Reticulomyxa filosa TaxID=46433 RepID=X6MMQ2_RETFI|nr:hypothetical protein RFI_22467 [Reticulomyxa filosa]|eukprot:ETO14901.1 hypothetical protein RFI_22467 [Reticulomyxa filosa]